jgi:hypothetical protein
MAKKLFKEMALELYSASTIIGEIKLRRMEWVEYVTRMGKKTDACKVLLSYLKEETAWKIYE